MRISPRCLRELSGGVTIVSGNTGDHPLIVSLLTRIALAPRAEDFQSRNDAPSYLPADRLLVKRKEQLLGHVHLSRAIGWFQGVRLPLSKLNDFAMLPEYQRQAADGTDYAAALLQVAESTAVHEGAILAVQHTHQSEWLQRQGWSRCRAQGHTRANTRAILSHLDAQQSLRQRRTGHHGPAMEIRSWRHVELDCLSHVHRQLVTGMWGTLHRSEETWQWLAGRKAHDQILLAIDRSTDHRTSDDRPPPITDIPDEEEVDEETDGQEPNPASSMNGFCCPEETIGYAVLRDSCIVEMFTLPGFSSARSVMIAQACHDAIDRDYHSVELHTPATDPMHDLLVTAGGSWQRGNPADGEWMFKLLAPEKWLKRLYPVLQQRSHEGKLARPLEIALDVEDRTYQLTLSRRSVQLHPGSSSMLEHSQGRVACDRRTFQNLLTSNLMLSEAIAQGRLETDSPKTAQTLAILFPFQLFWQSPFELLRL